MWDMKVGQGKAILELCGGSYEGGENQANKRADVTQQRRQDFHKTK